MPVSLKFEFAVGSYLDFGHDGKQTAQQHGSST